MQVLPPRVPKKTYRISTDIKRKNQTISNWRYLDLVQIYFDRLRVASWSYKRSLALDTSTVIYSLASVLEYFYP